MIVYAIIAIVGNAIVTASQNIAMFIVGRAIAGFAAIGFIALGEFY
jgi:predicted MFS family arabinose efflux permease